MAVVTTGPPEAGPDPRAEELATALAAMRARIAAAADTADRDPAGLTLIAVTKTFPLTDVLTLLDLGVTDLGENRDGEASAKAAAVAERGPLQPRWHFLGRLQRKKVGSVARYADAVHSLDRPEIATALGRAAGRAGRVIDAFVQVNLDPAGPDAQGRGGVRPNDVVDLAEHIASTPGLRLVGVMALAPLGADPDATFARLAVLAEGVRARAPLATAISAGMSGDLESAIRHGATHLRVGTALLGDRPLGSDHVR